MLSRRIRVEIITDNQVLKSFFTKLSLSRREARWLETLGNFGIFPITLKSGMLHVLGDTLSRAPHATFNAVEALKCDLGFIINEYDSDKTFGTIVKFLKGENITDKYQLKKLEKISTMFLLKDGKI